MASTACSEACLAVCLHVRFLCVKKSTRCPRDGTPVFGSSCAVPPQKSVGLFSFRVGCSVAWKFRMDTNSMEWNERPRVRSLVPFQPFQPGRNKLRHALISWVDWGPSINLSLMSLFRYNCTRTKVKDRALVETVGMFLPCLLYTSDAADE